jgi:UPF0716 protein FxsA
MSIVKWALIGILLLPLAELAGFLLIASLLGWLLASAALVGTSILGAVLLRQSGRRELARLQPAFRQDGIAALRLDYPPVAKLLGAILLVLPGFITGIVGAALFLPPLRGWAASALTKAVSATRPRGEGRRDPVLDLEPHEWHRIDRRGHGARKRRRRKTESSSC